jgi:hypothetical protein
LWGPDVDIRWMLSWPTIRKVKRMYSKRKAGCLDYGA